MTEATKENPAPLDGYESAKPDEPIFTLQGGDPLAAPLVRIWAYLTRVRAGASSSDVSMIDAPIFVARTTSVAHDPEKAKNLLLRATAAEQVSWHMDGYRRGEVDVIEEVAERVGELEKLDIYDIRRRMSSAISNAIAFLEDYRSELKSRDFIQVADKIDDAITLSIFDLENLHELVEIRRGN